MSGFIRVRAKSGPKHEFHAAAGEVAAHPELYVVIDKTPVATPDPPLYVAAESKPSNPVAPVVAPEPVGETEKEND